MDTKEEKRDPAEKEERDHRELAPEELEQADGGSWLGKIWNKIKSFGP